jgi:F0F1-type ATP synthase delta subunit
MISIEMLIDELKMCESQNYLEDFYITENVINYLDDKNLSGKNRPTLISVIFKEHVKKHTVNLIFDYIETKYIDVLYQIGKVTDRRINIYYK